jgi:hypothetical protein
LAWLGKFINAFQKLPILALFLKGCLRGHRVNSPHYQYLEVTTLLSVYRSPVAMERLLEKVIRYCNRLLKPYGVWCSVKSRRHAKALARALNVVPSWEACVNNRFSYKPSRIGKRLAGEILRLHLPGVPLEMDIFQVARGLGRLKQKDPTDLLITIWLSECIGRGEYGTVAEALDNVKKRLTSVCNGSYNFHKITNFNLKVYLGFDSKEKGFRDQKNGELYLKLRLKRRLFPWDVWVEETSICRLRETADGWEIHQY